MRKASLLALLPISFAGAGCSSTRPIHAWQQRLTDYTMREGGGDLNVLRESAELRSSDTLRPAQIRFDHDDIAATGMGPGTRDTHGVMVGQHTGGGNPTFFFLVGVMNRSSSGRSSKIEDIRMVSCTIQNGRHHWKTSDPNPVALNQYLASRARHLEGPDSAQAGQSFPLVDDNFTFEVRDGNAQAADARSGAVWRVPLN